MWGLGVFSLSICLLKIEIIYILCLIIIIKSEVWAITHCLGLGHETMVCAVYLFIFLFPCHRKLYGLGRRRGYTLLAKTLGLTSIRHRSKMTTSDRCLIEVSPRVITFYEFNPFKYWSYTWWRHHDFDIIVDNMVCKMEFATFKFYFSINVFL